MELLYFILGIVFVQYFIPLVDSFSSLLFTWIESKKVGLSEMINNANIKMRRASTEEDCPTMNQIGFCIPDDESEEEDDEEDGI